MLHFHIAYNDGTTDRTVSFATFEAAASFAAKCIEELVDFQFTFGPSA